MPKNSLLGLILCIAVLFSGCQKLPDVGTAEITPQEWKLMLDSSKNSTLNIYYDYSDPKAIEWLSKVVKPYIKDLYGLEITLTPLNLTTALTELKDDKLNERNTGQYDLFLLNKPGFKKLKNAGVLYSPYVSKLPNVSFNQVKEAYDFNNFDGASTENMAAYIGRNQLIMVYNEDKIDKAPKSLQELAEYIDSNSGSFTIPSLNSREGRAFIDTVALTLCDQKKLLNLKLTKPELKQALMPAIEFLKDMKPNLYSRGNIFPKNMEEMDRLFREETIYFSMTFDPNRAVTAVKEEKYPDSPKSFVFSGGTTGYGQYAVIPFNSSNKSGAMVFINELLGAELQASMYNPKNWGNLPSVDPVKMPDKSGDAITGMIFKRAGIKYNEMSQTQLAQLPFEREQMIIQIIRETVGFE